VVKIRILQESYQDLAANNNAAPFRPGMSATVDIQTKKVLNVITVPIQSVTTRSDSTAFKEKNKERGGEEDDEVVVKNENDKTQDNSELIKIEECVFVYDAVEGKVKMVKVKTGIQDNNNIEITSGIKEGDEVISAPYSAIAKELKDGDKVNKVDKSELFTVTKK
jgi:HlyD family secretion protein